MTNPTNEALTTTETVAGNGTSDDFNPDDHYFWLDRQLAYLPCDALSKKALKLYLLYCRSANPKRLQCSFSSYRDARVSMGLSRLAMDSAREELIKKGFIRKRVDINPGFYKTVPVEVLPFPDIVVLSTLLCEIAFDQAAK